MALELPLPTPPPRANVAQGARAPFSIRVWAPNSDPDFDASTITSATITVNRLYDGTSATWTATSLTGAVASLAAFVYMAASDGSDFATLGEYDCAVNFNTSSGPVPGEAFFLNVEPAPRYRIRS